MCYICEDQGTVGPNYKAGLKECRAAWRVWAQSRASRRSADYYEHGPKPRAGQDWLSRPKRIWSKANRGEVT